MDERTDRQTETQVHLLSFAFAAKKTYSTVGSLRQGGGAAGAGSQAFKVYIVDMVL